MQKFNKGDWVQIAKDLGPYMQHFSAGCDAIVVASCAEKYGGDSNKYTLYLKGEGECSWYEEWQLTLIKRGCLDQLEEWQCQDDEIDRKRSNLDWIFTHGEDVLKTPYGSTVEALARGFGLTNLWGSHGEGFAYQHNALVILALAKPFLETNDQQGWLDQAARIQIEQEGSATVD